MPLKRKTNTQGGGKAGRAGPPHGTLGDFLALMVRLLSHPEEAEPLLRDRPDVPEVRFGFRMWVGRPISGFVQT